MSDVNSSNSTLVCKAECNTSLKSYVICDHCQGTYHKKCGKFKKIISPDNTTYTICLPCYIYNPDFKKLTVTNLSDMDLENRSRSSSTSSNKRLRIDNEEELNEHEFDEDNPSNRTLLEELRAIHKHMYDTDEKFMSEVLEVKKSNKELLSTVSTLSTDVSKLKSVSRTEVIIGGLYLPDDTSSIDITTYVLKIAEFLKVNLPYDEVRRTRIVKKNSKNSRKRIDEGADEHSDAECMEINESSIEQSTTDSQQNNFTLSSIIVTFYSSSYCYKLLDAMKRRKAKLSFSSVFPEFQFQSTIYIALMLESELMDLSTETKKWAKKHGYAYVWFNEDKLMLRKDSRSRYIHVTSRKVLQDLEKPQSNRTISSILVRPKEKNNSVKVSNNQAYASVLTRVPVDKNGKAPLKMKLIKGQQNKNLSPSTLNSPAFNYAGKNLTPTTSTDQQSNSEETHSASTSS